MATFTALYAMVDDELNMGWQVIPMTQKDIEGSSAEHSKFLVSLEYNNKTLETCYRTCGCPNAQDVFACVVIDARSVYDSKFPEFCSGFGYDTDSMKAFRLFKDCKKQCKKLLSLLGDDLFQQFMECEMDW
jgi:hypothetical protein